MNGYSSMSIDEDDDELLYEIDVKLQRTKQSIYLFQYPTRPYYQKYDETSFLNARIKEKYSLVEMDLLIDTQSTNYYSSRGKQYADSTNNENGKQYFNSDRMDKQTVASTNSSDGNKLETKNIDIETLKNHIAVVFVQINRLLTFMSICFFSIRI